jgi:hypothetical protein
VTEGLRKKFYIAIFINIRIIKKGDDER